MDPKKATHPPAVTGPAEEDWGDDCLNEAELEDLLGRDVDVDEPEDWRAVDF
ncbi:MAG TPA: hypothetical protein VGC50_11090 [Gammaproteobacteria bacterium]|jgi:hypothetical protein